MNMEAPTTPTLEAEAPMLGHEPDGNEESRLWHALRESDGKNRDVLDSLVVYYTPLVRAESSRLAYQLPRHVDRQELIADGLVGLYSAIMHFDPNQGVEFTAYARRRIMGAMLDRVRSLDGIPRSSRKATRRISKAMQGFQSREGRPPDESELAKEVGVNTDALHELERQAGLNRTLSLEADNGGGSDGAVNNYRDGIKGKDTGGLAALALSESKEKLVEALTKLPDRERAIVVLYYQQGLMLKEIAAAMDVSERRVSQLHTRALLRLRAFMEDQNEDAEEDVEPDEE